jgi:glutathione synthase/RimK-type ligase-like ATP-grasp enzyme
MIVMKQQVLLLSSKDDAHAGALAWALRRNGFHSLWSPSLRFGRGAKLSMLANTDGIEAHGAQIDLSKFSAVWHRLPESPSAEEFAQEDRDFVVKQWSFFQKNAFALASDFIDALWVNRPAAAEAADNKWLQLRAAHAVGLRFPEAIASNDADEVRELLRRCGKLVFKQFYSYVWQSRSTGDVHGSGVVLLDESSDLPDAAIAVCPGIYQRYIDKAFDVRVTVIGNRMFAVRLSKRAGGAYVDWRPHIRDDDMQIEFITLPTTVETQLRALMTRLDLVVGCIDLVVDHDGNMFFLEVNQQGQFLFVEQSLPGVPLLRAMTSLLMSGRSDYAIDASAELHFSEYLQSDLYKELLIAPPAPNPSFVYEA